MDKQTVDINISGERMDKQTVVTKSLFLLNNTEVYVYRIKRCCKICRKAQTSDRSPPPPPPPRFTVSRPISTII